MKEYAAARNTSLYTALLENVESPLFRQSRAKEYVRLIERYRAIYAQMDLTDLVAEVLNQSGYEAMLRLCGEEDRLDNLAELKQAVYDYARKAGSRSRWAAIWSMQRSLPTWIRRSAPPPSSS